MTFRAFSFIFLLLSLITGCGFQLKGLSNLPENLIQLDLTVEKFTNQEEVQLITILKQAGAELVNTTTATKLRVNLQRANERIIASNATQSLRIFSISRNLDYVVTSAEGKLLLQRDVKQSREIELDTDDVLQLEQSRMEVIREINNALFQQILDQLKNL